MKLRLSTSRLAVLLLAVSCGYSRPKAVPADGPSAGSDASTVCTFDHSSLDQCVIAR